MLAGVGGRVGGDGRGGVGVGDGDGHALAGRLARPVRRAELLAGVALDRVRDLLAVRLRQRGGRVRAVVGGERPGVAEHRVRRGQGVAVARLVRGVVQAGDGEDGAVQRGGHGGVGGRGAVGLAALGVVVELGAEGLLDGGHVTGDGEVVPGGAGDRQTGGLQPVGDGLDLGLGGAVAGVGLLRREVLAVRGGVRVGHGPRVRLEAGGVAPGEVDADGDLGAVAGGALVGRALGPDRLGARE